EPADGAAIADRARDVASPNLLADASNRRAGGDRRSVASVFGIPRRDLMPKYALPSLPYEVGALEPHLSGEILDLHYHKQHAAYVKGANDTLEKLADAREHQEFGHLGQLEKSLAFHISGHVLHSLLWKNMSPDGGGTPNGGLSAALDRDFGSFDAF